MKIGVVFPQTESGTDVTAIRDYTLGVEQLGFTHLLVYDHVLGASTASRPNWSGPYTSETLFHEPFVLFGYLAAITRQLELVTGVIILPQRQTALVAKQAAELDLLSQGRFRLGVGIGWNAVEYEGLNESFRNRGARLEEQIAVLRDLWSAPAITFHGKWHTISDAGIKPLPVQRPIPIWIGGTADAAIERAGRLADGWFPQGPPNDEAKRTVALLQESARAAGRDPAQLGIEARLSLGSVPRAEWKAFATAWQQLGATHLTLNTMGMGFTALEQHLEALRDAGQLLAGN